jgi:transcriptional activator SPT7
MNFRLQDNHDAEAFLKPVSKGDVPDYYDGVFKISGSLRAPLNIYVVIPNPMDLQTMLKKVKTKQYKSKKEFKDDLDLIWGNCFTYNAAPVCYAFPFHKNRLKCSSLFKGTSFKTMRKTSSSQIRKATQEYH